VKTERSPGGLLRAWLLAAGMLACALPTASPANPCADPGDGMGGTGVRGEASAGRSGDPDGMGGTGVVGVITGFASICVNGLEIHYESATPVTVDGEPSTTNALRLGHVVAVEASGSGKDLKARSIAVVHELSGTVTAVDAAHHSLRVLGQPVSVDHSSAASAALGGLRAGDSVRVSGMRGRGGEVAATLLEPAGASRVASIRGPVQSLDGGTAVIGGVRVRLPGGTSTEPGRRVLVTGSWNGTELDAQRVMPDPVAGLVERVVRIELQGRARKSGKDLSVSGVPVGVSRDTRGSDSVDDDERVVVSGRVVNGGVRATEIRVERHAGGERSERAEPRQRADKAPGGNDAERPVQPRERHEKTERPERIERPDRAQRPERAERTDRTEHPEKER
jgi:uncharacterized protein DUF5666